MVDTGPAADTSAEAVFADKHTNFVSWSAKCVSMVQMEGNLLPVVCIDAAMQIDTRCDSGDWQVDQGADE